jgi:hypothetical protein
MTNGTPDPQIVSSSSTLTKLPIEELRFQYTTLRRSDDLDTEQLALRDALYAELARRAAVAPEGYTLPKAAVKLVAAANASGWQHLVQWQTDNDGTPFVTVQVGRAITAVERADFTSRGFHGGYWKFEATWHGRGAGAGRVRLFGSVRGSTPEHPSCTTTTVAKVLAVISNDS